MDFSPYAFSPYANWVVPNKVMQGQYPGQSPEMASTPELAAERMTKILVDGEVTTFCSFLNEQPPQPDMPAEGVEGYLPYKPLAEKLVQELNLERSLNFLHLPFVIDKELSMDRMVTVTEEMQKRVDAGEVLYLHCSGGVGRAGTAAACLYARLSGAQTDPALKAMQARFSGAQAEDVLDHIQKAFDTRGSGLKSPVSHRQRKFVEDFVAKVKP